MYAVNTGKGWVNRLQKRPALFTAIYGRSNFYHSDLRQARLTAGIALASQGGPDAMVLREARRQVGVSPTHPPTPLTATSPIAMPAGGRQ